MKNKYLFPNKTIEYDDYLKQIGEFIKQGKVYFCPTICLETGVESLLKINDPKQREIITSTAVLTDKKFNIPYSNSPQMSRKLPTLMTIATLTANHYDSIKDLSNDELVLLGYFSCVVEPSQLSNHLEFPSTKEVLSKIVEKTTDIDEQMLILWVLEDKYYEFGIDKGTKEDLDKFRKESITFIDNHSKEDLFNMVKTTEEIYDMLYEHKIYI